MSRRSLSGVSLVELMIGLALGLSVTAGCAALWSLQLREGRDQLVEARLDQDLRAALDLVGRDLRRAGHWSGAASAAASTANPYARLATTAGPTDAVELRYSLDAVARDVVDPAEMLGFRVRGGVLQNQLGDGNWQPMTDPSALEIIAFGIVPVERSVDLGAFCPTPCPATSADCPPRRISRSVTLDLAARTVGAPSLERRMHTQVGLRNDVVVGRCAP